MPKPYVENQKSNFHTMSTTTAQRSLPMDNNKYIQQQRSSTKNSRKYKTNKARPKPLQVENEKYYEHIFPPTNQYNYQPDSLNHAEL